MKIDKLIELVGILKTDLQHVLLPQICNACKRPLFKNETIICLVCKTRLPLTHFWQKPDNDAARLFWGRYVFDFVSSFVFFVNKGIVQQMLHNLKYRNKPEVGRLLGELYGLHLAQLPLFNEPFVLVPVPMHPKKQLIRGYNQAEQIAIGLAKALPNAKMENNALQKIQHTSSQTKKSRLERYENVFNGFHLANPNLIANQHVVLVDDVLTTGATLESCAQAIATGNPLKQSVLTIAIAAQLG